MSTDDFRVSDSGYLTMSRELLEDFKKYAARDRVKEIIELLEEQVDITLTDAINMIKDKYGIED